MPVAAAQCQMLCNSMSGNRWYLHFIRTKLITFVIYLIDLSDLNVKIQNLTGNT